MPEFVWEARGRRGELRRGSMEAEGEEAVYARLRQQQLIPLKVKRRSRLWSSIGRVRPRDLVTFTRLFATMVDAGLPIVQSLEILEGQSDNPRFAAVLRDVKATVEQGASFGDALRRHPRVFDALYVSLVQAGLVGGVLDTMLRRLAEYIEKAHRLRRQVRGALVYPGAVLIVFLGVLVVLLGFVIPGFEQMFQEFGAGEGLPLLTQAVLGVSRFVVGNAPWIVIALAAGSFAVAWAYRQPRGKRLFHKAFLAIPLVGPVLQKIAVARFTRTLGTLLSSGVPILDALEIVSKTVGNSVIEGGILYARDRIREGKTLAEPLMEAQVFPAMVVQMVGVGEQTGSLDKMLAKIADFYEEEVDVSVAALTRLIEPALMVVLGGTVGIVLIAMYMPIFDLAGRIKAD